MTYDTLHQILADRSSNHPPHYFDCQKCGACCRPSMRFLMTVPIFPEELPTLQSHHPAGLEPIPGEVCTTTKNAAFRLKFQQWLGCTRCFFLQEKLDGTYACGIYNEERPINCIVFAPGGEGCKRIRKAMEIEIQFPV